MKIGIMQPYFFPYVGYFQLIHSADKFIFYDDVSFIMRGWINRNNILINNSKHFFSVPLHKASPNKLIKDIDIVSDSDWKNKLYKTFHFAYKNAPYFKEVFPLISSIFSQDFQKISELAKASINCIVNYLEIETEIAETSSVYLNQNLKREFRVIDIILKENADICIVPIGGRELYDKSYFKSHGIKLYYLKPVIEEYKQYIKNNFIPNLSIIDIIMFNSKEESQNYIKNYELI